MPVVAVVTELEALVLLDVAVLDVVATLLVAVVAGAHTLRAQTSPRAHATAQAPQFVGSFATSTQLWPHWVSPNEHEVAQTPAEQSPPVAQTLPQAPQFDGSLSSATHTPAHWVCPTAQTPPVVAVEVSVPPTLLELVAPAVVLDVPAPLVRVLPLLAPPGVEASPPQLAIKLKTSPRDVKKVDLVMMLPRQRLPMNTPNKVLLLA